TGVVDSRRTLTPYVPRWRGWRGTSRGWTTRAEQILLPPVPKAFGIHGRGRVRLRRAERRNRQRRISLSGWLTRDTKRYKMIQMNIITSTRHRTNSSFEDLSRITVECPPPAGVARYEPGVDHSRWTITTNCPPPAPCPPLAGV